MNTVDDSTNGRNGNDDAPASERTGHADSERRSMVQLAAEVDAAKAGKTVTFGPGQPLLLDSGRSLAPLTIAYQTYGKLNADRSNTILVCHALTGDQYVIDTHPVTGKPGWWTTMVGPGRPVDTESYFVICINTVGGCMGTTGPGSTVPIES